MIIDIELKSYPDTPYHLAAAVARLIVDRGISSRVFVSSFDPRLVKRFRREAERIGASVPTAAIYSGDSEVPRVLRGGLGAPLSRQRDNQAGLAHGPPPWRARTETRSRVDSQHPGGVRSAAESRRRRCDRRQSGRSVPMVTGGASRWGGGSAVKSREAGHGLPHQASP
jgi:glycerophosphoryl diester phosphodiesterase